MICRTIQRIIFLYDESNKKRPGTFKDETAGCPVSHFTGLRAKMYSLKYKDIQSEGEKEKQIAKGISKSTIKNDLRHSHYEQCLFAGIPKNVK